MRIARLVMAVAVLTACWALAPAHAQDLDRGKSAPKLFSSHCSACHRSTRGLARGKDARALSEFLRQHYTSSRQTASELAGYLAGARGAQAPRDPAANPASATRTSGREGEEARRAERRARREERAARSVRPEGEDAPSRASAAEERARRRAAALPVLQEPKVLIAVEPVALGRQEIIPGPPTPSATAPQAAAPRAAAPSADAPASTPARVEPTPAAAPSAVPAEPSTAQPAEADPTRAPVVEPSSPATSEQPGGAVEAAPATPVVPTHEDQRPAALSTEHASEPNPTIAAPVLVPPAEPAPQRAEPSAPPRSQPFAGPLP